ncbi:MAG: hypothetical protein HYY76_14715 [Acidobacteria bacterium]|nr:hypothetical protein [Acidobacteriota bacterium]
MRVLGPIDLDDALAAWALHECRGRRRRRLPRDVREIIDGPDGRAAALRFILATDIADEIDAAEPLACFHVAITAADVPAIVTGCRHWLDEWARWLIDEPTPAGRWVRTLAASTDPVAGPLLGITRESGRTITLLDGNHRAAAWVVHGDRGRCYAMVLNLIISRRECWWERSAVR